MTLILLYRAARYTIAPILIGLLCSGALAADAFLDPKVGGVVVERSKTPATFLVYLTDSNGNRNDSLGKEDAFGMPWPRVIVADIKDAKTGLYTADIGVFNLVNQKRVAYRDVWDAGNITIKKRIPQNGLPVEGPAESEDLEVSELRLESVFFDPLTKYFSVESVFDRISLKVGNDIGISVPDLYADTNGDGRVDSGDWLYGLVDMSVYLDAVPAFALDDHFSIINGIVMGLPGMRFSASPFTFNPDVGFTAPGFTGEGIAGSLHIISAASDVPEASNSLGLLFASLALLTMIRQHGRSKVLLCRDTSHESGPLPIVRSSREGQGVRDSR